MYACPFSNARLVSPINNNLEYYHINDCALLHPFYNVFTNGAEGDRLDCFFSPVLSNVIPQSLKLYHLLRWHNEDAVSVVPDSALTRLSEGGVGCLLSGVRSCTTAMLWLQVNNYNQPQITQ